MKDLDSAVGRLDNIFMSFYSIIALIIVAVVLDSQLTSLLTGTGAFILGLSWLIGGSLAEVLTSIIFLFIKHPYDVGDRVDIENHSYIVKEISLLSTLFLDQNNALVQAPHNILNTKYITNIRRSPTMSETFAFDVAFDTTLAQIEALREKMLVFVKEQRRDFLPSFDVTIIDMPDQEKLCLTADIRYKSNWQQGALKAKRRNQWICTLKQSMTDLGIYGPAGNPKALPEPKRFTQVPWEEVKSQEDKKVHQQALDSETKRAIGNYKLADNDAIILDQTQEVFGEKQQLPIPSPGISMLRTYPEANPSMDTTSVRRLEDIEMGPMQ